jgi:hypothetical protein
LSGNSPPTVDQQSPQKRDQLIKHAQRRKDTDYEYPEANNEQQLHSRISRQLEFAFSTWRFLHGYPHGQSGC